MNIFWLDEDPRKSARFHGDKHVNKMLLEAAQVLCTSARLNGLVDDRLYRVSHKKHPITTWATESKENWLRTRDQAEALNEEFKGRYDKKKNHKSWDVVSKIKPGDIDFPSISSTPRPQVMPEEYRVPGKPVVAYRRYYTNEKATWAEWKHTSKPPWLKEMKFD